jgi:hypothetical protein
MILGYCEHGTRIPDIVSRVTGLSGNVSRVPGLPGIVSLIQGHSAIESKVTRF